MPEQFKLKLIWIILPLAPVVISALATVPIFKPGVSPCRPGTQSADHEAAFLNQSGTGNRSDLQAGCHPCRPGTQSADREAAFLNQSLPWYELATAVIFKPGVKPP